MFYMISRTDFLLIASFRYELQYFSSAIELSKFEGCVCIKRKNLFKYETCDLNRMVETVTKYVKYMLRRRVSLL